MSLKQGRPSGRPSSRSSIVGHPGASPEKGEPVFSSSPRTPLLHNGIWERWPIDADAPWKSHGRLRGTARTNPSTAFPPSFENRRNGCRFSTAPTGRGASSPGVRSVSLFTTNGPYNRWASETATQSTRPRNRGRSSCLPVLGPDIATLSADQGAGGVHLINAADGPWMRGAAEQADSPDRSALAGNRGPRVLGVRRT